MVVLLVALWTAATIQAPDSATRARLDPLVPPRDTLHHVVTALRSQLAACLRRFSTGQSYARADSVKAWAPARLARLEDAVRRYRLAARDFMRRARIK